jgi:hypothetical protein
MEANMYRWTLAILTIVVLFVSAGFGAGLTDSLKPGKAELQSASQLAFGPDGILFIGDARQGAVFAVATEDTKAPTSPVRIDIKAVNQKIAAVLGVRPDDVLINDMKVNPISQKVYIAVSRGRTASAAAVILQIDGSNQIKEFSLDNVRFDKASLPDSPEVKPDAPLKFADGEANANPRTRTISDMSYVNGKLFVAGLSNEEFASDLRTVPFPFTAVSKGTGVRIWHTAHGTYETAAPIDKFVPYTINRQPFILASYACTPLVKIPVADLKPGAKVVGETIAELGQHNTPLEMIPYRRDGHEFILMTTNHKGVMKLSLDNPGQYAPINPPTAACSQLIRGVTQAGHGPKECQSDVAGVPLQVMPDIKGVWQMAKLNDTHAVVMADSQGQEPEFTEGNANWFTLAPGRTLDLTTITLP